MNIDFPPEAALTIAMTWAEQHANRYEDPADFGKAIAKLVATVLAELGPAQVMQQRAQQQMQGAVLAGLGSAHMSMADSLDRQRAEYNRALLQELRQAERNSQTYKGTPA